MVSWLLWLRVKSQYATRDCSQLYLSSWGFLKADIKNEAADVFYRISSMIFGGFFCELKQDKSIYEPLSDLRASGEHKA